MLEIGGLGFVRPVRPTPRKLRSDACILVFNGYKNELWFWIGSAIQLKNRRTATARVEKIDQEGHRLGREVIGGKGTKLITVDQDLMEENSEVAGLYSQLVALLESPMIVKTETDAKGSLIYAVFGDPEEQTSETEPEPVPDPVVASETTTEETETVTRPVELKTRFDLEAALMAIIRVQLDIHIKYSFEGETETLVIESAEGLRHTIKREDGKLSFSWDPKTPKEMKNAVKEELKRLV
jgi:hypothetical protein